MGIESDQLVFDYLSRVGDLAQQQQLSSGARMRLVATLRGEIDRQRGTDGSDSPAVVRRILGRLGAPGELVSAAAESGDGAVPLPSPRADGAGGTADGRGVPRARRGMLRKDASRKGASQGAEEPASSGSARPGPAVAEPVPEERGAGEPVPDWPSASAPHMTGLGQAPSEGEPDWWRIEPGPFGEGGQGAAGMPGAMGPGTAVPGFVGGLESPELFGMPGTPKAPGPRAPVEEEPGPAAGGREPAAEGEEPPAEPVPPARRKLRLRRPRRAVVDAGAAARPRLSNPLLLLAAVLLVAGAVLGSWLALAGGWLLAYSSRKFSRAEAKWVAMGLPGVVVAGAFVWVWGRMDGRWGAPLAEGAVGDAMTEAWPVVVRVAAVASALYLVWRSRRLPG
ncbi:MULTISPECIES: hypothetical protein [unclassified Streptomyces]|uniref:hypothetical protein n=1 Tax=unclassified Streptomyces TaxID=2593676 RepID=UPI002E0E0BB7|nr:MULTISPECIES: hypothetical protein [unclassified Streptomyces]WSQ85691.1 hypothetical protein OG722_15555 [Streptomyces sp. NBC_01212]WSR08216.1 hypothetical protein OG265_20455 [Streptomyces sp. NBC_01208]